jgi:serine/threonine protein kinase
MKDVDDEIEFLCLDSQRMEVIKDDKRRIYGVRLFGSKNAMEFFCLSLLARDNWMERLKKVCILLDVFDQYFFGKVLGRGNFAKVYLCKRKADNKEFAIKTITKEKIMEHSRNVRSVYREIKVLRIAIHPNIIKLYEVYEDDLYIHLVTEYLEGGEMFKRLQSKGVYSEKDASIAIKYILEALDYCHKKNIIHRDLKAENLILS